MCDLCSWRLSISAKLTEGVPSHSSCTSPKMVTKLNDEYYGVCTQFNNTFPWDWVGYASLGAHRFYSKDFQWTSCNEQKHACSKKNFICASKCWVRLLLSPNSKSRLFRRSDSIALVNHRCKLQWMIDGTSCSLRQQLTWEWSMRPPRCVIHKRIIIQINTP
jgi:hypothetical protein